MSGLRKQIEKEFDKEIAKWTDRELYGVVSSLEKLKGLLADTVIIPTKQLEEIDCNKWVGKNFRDIVDDMFDREGIDVVSNADILRYFIKKELLEESK